MIRLIWGVIFSLTTTIADGQSPIQPSNNLHPAVSPDGAFIVFESDRDGNGNIYIMGVNGADVRRLTDHPAHDTAPTWSRDGSRILFTSNRDVRRHPWPYYSMKPDGSDLQKIENPEEVFRNFSPDGTRTLLFEEVNGNTDIYIQNADGSNRRRLTTDPAFDSDMSFSPAGLKIVYESFVGNVSSAGIYIMNTDGTGKVRLADGTDPKWSPDGAHILYKARNSAGKCCDVFIMQADGSEKKRLAETAYFHRWLPDGSRIIYFSTISGKDQIYSMKPDGSDKRRLTE